MTAVHAHRRRAGVAVFWALVVLAVLGATAATAAWKFLAARRTLDQRLNRAQALWLARAGAELAAARLLADADGYTGETAEPIPGGQVRIMVEKDAAAPNTYRVRCEARYPAGDPTAVLQSLARTATRRTDGGAARVELTDAAGRP